LLTALPPELLLEQFRLLLAKAPDFARYHSTSEEHQHWLGQAYALLGRWKSFEAMSARVAIDSLGYSNMREGAVAKVFAILYRAIADLELRLLIGTEGEDSSLVDAQ
jgi:hypothetical protein